MQLSENFDFLGAYDAKLVQLAALAERYFREDPATCIFKLRQFAELLSQQVAARHAVYLGERESFEETLRRLSYERIIPKEAADIFHALRKVGNRAVHALPAPSPMLSQHSNSPDSSAFGFTGHTVRLQTSGADRLCPRLSPSTLRRR